MECKRAKFFACLTRISHQENLAVGNPDGGREKMVAETYLSTLSKPLLGQRSSRLNFAAFDRVFFKKSLY